MSTLLHRAHPVYPEVRTDQSAPDANADPILLVSVPQTQSWDRIERLSQTRFLVRTTDTQRNALYLELSTYPWIGFE